MEEGKNKITPILLLLKVMVNPVEGWKSVRRSGLKVEAAQQECFYPLIAFFALSKFSDLFYSHHSGVASLLMEAVVGFVSFFFGYFCIMILLKIVMPGQVKENMTTDFAKIFVIMSLSSLCVFFSLIEILPMLWAMLIFLPLWTIYAISRGTRFFRFPENRKMYCSGILSILIIGVPCLIDWCLMKLLPL